MKLLSKFFSAFIGDTGSCKDNHVSFNLYWHSIKQGIYTTDYQLAIFFVYFRNTTTYIINAIIFNCPSDKFFILLSSSPYIHIEHVGFSAMDLMLIKHGMLCNIHTAYFR